MSLVLVNGIAATRMELHRPRIGPWFAIADLDGVDVPSGPATIDVEGGALTLKGTISPQRSGAFADRVRVRIVGGGGGLATALPAKFYGPGTAGGHPVSLPIGEVLVAAGEKISTTSDPVVLAKVLPKWARLAIPAHQALASLVDAVGASWRTLDDGTIWVGTETWPATPATLDYALLEEDPYERRVVLAIEDPTLRPGVTLDGRQLSYVVYTFEPDATRVEAWIDLGDRDRMRSGIASFVRSLVDPRIDPLAKYGATIVAQQADLTVDLTPDSPKLPGLTNVPIRSAFPGVAAKVAAGTRCDVSFENGDLSKPMVVAFDGAGLKELTVTADTVVTVKSPSVRLADGDIPIARQGDLVSISLPFGANSAGPVAYAPGVPSGFVAFGTIVSGSRKGKTA